MISKSCLSGKKNPLQVECRLHDQMAAEQQTIAVAMMVEEGNRTDKIL